MEKLTFKEQFGLTAVRVGISLVQYLDKEEKEVQELTAKTASA